MGTLLVGAQVKAAIGGPPVEYAGWVTYRCAAPLHCFLCDDEAALTTQPACVTRGHCAFRPHVYVRAETCSTLCVRPPTRAPRGPSHARCPPLLCRGLAMFEEEQPGYAPHFNIMMGGERRTIVGARSACFDWPYKGPCSRLPAYSGRCQSLGPYCMRRRLLQGAAWRLPHACPNGMTCCELPVQARTRSTPSGPTTSAASPPPLCAHLPTSFPAVPPHTYARTLAWGDNKDTLACMHMREPRRLNGVHVPALT